MYEIELVADMSKSSSVHKLAAATMKLSGKHTLDHAPKGAHALVTVAIPPDKYLLSLNEHPDGHVTLVFTPGVVA